MWIGFVIAFVVAVYVTVGGAGRPSVGAHQLRGRGLDASLRAPQVPTPKPPSQGPHR